ncbi:hypothetical protein ACSSS7_001648 [Eimeria intestinalis]
MFDLWPPPAAPAQISGVWAPRCMRIVSSLALLLTWCSHEWPWGPSFPCCLNQGRPSCSPHAWGASAGAVLEGGFKTRQFPADAFRPGPHIPKPPERHLSSDDEFLEDEEPLEIWGDLNDTRMTLSTTPRPCPAALRQAFNAALRRLVDRGVRTQLLLRHKLPLSFAVELQGASPAWPRREDLREHDLLREVLERRVLRVATVMRGPTSPSFSLKAFNTSFLREIVDEIDAHYSSAETREGGDTKGNDTPSSSSRQDSIQIEYVAKASTAVALQALDAGQAHMTDIDMVLSHNPFNGITPASRYSRSDQVVTQGIAAIVKAETNVASLQALRESIFMASDQAGRTVVVDSPWTQQSLARVLPPYTIYELLSEGVPKSQLLDLLADDEAVAAPAQLPLPWLKQGLHHFAIGATYATGALFLMDRHGDNCVAKNRAAAAASAAASAETRTSERLGEDPALFSLRREFTKKSVSLNSHPKKFYSSRRSSAFLADGEGAPNTEGDDSYPATPGPWSHEPSTPVGETELFDSLRTAATGEPLASGRRYLRTRALQDAYNAALGQLLKRSVLDQLVEELQEINVVPFCDCGGTVPGSVSRMFPPRQRIAADDALMDVLRTGIVLVGMPTGSKASIASPEVLYAQRAMVEVVAVIAAEYRVPLQTRFIRFPTAKHVLRALHKGLIHLADARVLFDYVSPQTHLGFRVRPTCALGASRLWMVVQNKEGMTSLEGLHRSLEENPDASQRKVGVLDQQLYATVVSVLPSSVVTEVMSVEEAAEALLSRSLAAVFGMATQQRRHLRSLLQAGRNAAARQDSEAAAMAAWEQEQQTDNQQAALFDAAGESRWALPLRTPPSAGSPLHGDNFSLFLEAADEGLGVSRADSSSSPEMQDSTTDESPPLASSMQSADDLFEQLAKAEGMPVEASSSTLHGPPAFIEVDTGVTAVMHSFLALSLRPQKPTG